MAFFNSEGEPRDFVDYLDFLSAVPNRNLCRSKVYTSKNGDGEEIVIMVTTDLVDGVLETVIVNGNNHGYVMTYETEEEAVAGHEVALQLVMDND